MINSRAQDLTGLSPILHVRLFHPVDDHYGFSPIEAASVAIDTHNAASRWNKALLDNAARPSGALVYAAREGRLSPEQFERLKTELQEGFQGAKNAGRPLLLEGGLDWKPLSLTPAELDFIEAKNSAAREIALALGVPPQLLGIPGDNTYSNYAEAHRAFWRQTILPLVQRTTKALSSWLAPAYPGHLTLKPDFDQVDALAPERDALWSRLNAATFLTEDEKRAATGYGPKPIAKMNPFHDDRGRFDFAPNGGVVPVAGKPGGGKPPPKPPAPPATPPAPLPPKPAEAPKPAAPPSAPKQPAWLPPDAGAKVPKEWGSGEPNQKGDGWRWFDPAGEKYGGIRIDRGDPTSGQLSQQVDHVVVRNGGKVIGRDGNPLPGDGSIKNNFDAAHIPLSEWLTWRTPFSPK